MTVTFRVPAEANATVAELLGEFSDWLPVAMTRSDGGEHSVTIELDAGTAYRFRYRLDGDRWVNDWAADGYVMNDYGGDDSVVDIIAVDVVSSVPAPPAPTPKRTRASRKAADGAAADKRKSKASRG